jgi:hypothetical protein
MSHQAVVSASLSRPKIHRFPAAASRRSKWLLFVTPVFMRTGMMFAALAVVVIMLSRLISFSSTAHFSMESALSASPTPVSNAMAAPIEKQSGDTIVITGNTGTIVGQMAKIPAQNEQITEIKPVTEVDNRSGRDLLSIINKY